MFTVMAKMEPTFDFVSYFTVEQFFSFRFRMGAMKKLSRWEHQAGSQSHQLPHMELVCATTPGVSPAGLFPVVLATSLSVQFHWVTTAHPVCFSVFPSTSSPQRLPLNGVPSTSAESRTFRKTPIDSVEI